MWILITLSEWIVSPLWYVSTAQIGNTESELKKLAAENPDLKDAYIAKQRRLKVRATVHNLRACLVSVSLIPVEGAFLAVIQHIHNDLSMLSDTTTVDDYYYINQWQS